MKLKYICQDKKRTNFTNFFAGLVPTVGTSSFFGVIPFDKINFELILADWA